MTSRRADPFAEIAKTVSAGGAADFHQRWVLDYGHSSVAEHAVVHLAIEHLSRLAADSIEETRLASYTEQSSRYQIMEPDRYHIPAEVTEHPELYQQYRETMNLLFRAYREVTAQLQAMLAVNRPQRPAETETAWRTGIRREAADAARHLLPAATLTNLGMTANARSAAHAISKLCSDPLAENRAVGAAIKESAAQSVPTLLKYAARNPYLVRLRSHTADEPAPAIAEPGAELLDWNANAVMRLAYTLQYPSGRGRHSNIPKADALAVIANAAAGRREHDPLPRAFETIHYTVELTMDYGALREFRRHRMLTVISQPLNTAYGYTVPPLLLAAQARPTLDQAMHAAARLYRDIREVSPNAAQYAVTHGHRQKALATLNLRELAEILRLRTGPRAHPSIRQPCIALREAIRQVHPELIQAITPGA